MLLWWCCAQVHSAVSRIGRMDALVLHDFVNHKVGLLCVGAGVHVVVVLVNVDLELVVALSEVSGAALLAQTGDGLADVVKHPPVRLVGRPSPVVESARFGAVVAAVTVGVADHDVPHGVRVVAVDSEVVKVEDSHVGVVVVLLELNVSLVYVAVVPAVVVGEHSVVDLVQDLLWVNVWVAALALVGHVKHALVRALFVLGNVRVDRVGRLGEGGRNRVGGNELGLVVVDEGLLLGGEGGLQRVKGVVQVAGHGRNLGAQMLLLGSATFGNGFRNGFCVLLEASDDSFAHLGDLANGVAGGSNLHCGKIGCVTVGHNVFNGGGLTLDLAVELVCVVNQVRVGDDVRLFPDKGTLVWGNEDDVAVLGFDTRPFLFKKKEGVVGRGRRGLIRNSFWKKKKSKSIATTISQIKGREKPKRKETHVCECTNTAHTKKANLHVLCTGNGHEGSDRKELGEHDLMKERKIN